MVTTSRLSNIRYPTTETFYLKTHNKIRKFVPASMMKPIDRIARLSFPTAIRNKLQPRKFRAFSIGLPKSGTTSIAEIFSVNYRSAHEPNPAEILEKLLAARKSRDGVIELRNYYENLHDCLCWLEMESSWHRGLFPEITYSLYPTARYVLTIRDCYSWADSLLNNAIIRCPKGTQNRFSTRSTGLFLKVMFGKGPFTYAPEEHVLEEANIFPLDNLFQFWAQGNQRIIDTINPSKLLILRTQEISNSLTKLAHFIGVPESSLSMDRSHARKAAKYNKVLSKIDPNFVEEKAELHCNDLMNQFFPNFSVKGLD